MGRWVRIDRRYNQPYRLTGYASRAIFKWTGLILAWVFVNSALAADHLGILDLATTGGLIWYPLRAPEPETPTGSADAADIYLSDADEPPLVAVRAAELPVAA